MQKLEFTVLDTIIPETNRYNKELSFGNQELLSLYSVSTSRQIVEGSGLTELAEELLVKFKK